MSGIDLRNEVPEADSAGCGSCFGSCLGSLFAFMALTVLCERMGGGHTGAQVVMAYLLGMGLGKLTSHLWQKEFTRPVSAKAGFIITGVPILLLTVVGMVQGVQKYGEVMERSGPGWGRADIANYTYPTLTTYLSAVLFLVLAMGWLMTSLGAYRRQQRGDRL